MLRFLRVVILLAPTLALAARYDPDPLRAALRQAATASHATVVDATGLALEPEKAPAIAAGLDEGLRQARLASDSARSLDAAARQRAAEMAAGVKASTLDLKIKELSEPIAAERLRCERLSDDQESLKKKVDEASDEDKEKLRPLLAKARHALRSADEALRPLEKSVDMMGAQAVAMKAARHDALWPLVEISSAAAGVNRHAEDFPAPMAEAKTLLGTLSQEPRDVSRRRAWEKLDLLRGGTRLLFEAADRACNRADDFRRHSAAYEKASGAFEKARLAASSGPAGAKPLLDEAHQALAQVRERLKKPER